MIVNYKYSQVCVTIIVLRNIAQLFGCFITMPDWRTLIHGLPSFLISYNCVIMPATNLMSTVSRLIMLSSQVNVINKLITLIVAISLE